MFRSLLQRCGCVLVYAGAACPGFGSWKLCCDFSEMAVVLECGFGFMSW